MKLRINYVVLFIMLSEGFFIAGFALENVLDYSLAIGITLQIIFVIFASILAIKKQKNTDRTK
ncbi:hypothetical protein EAI05_20265 [Bacillus subtilis]|nr:hypothetical protein C7M17_03140 [Bacillus subtilis]RNA66533.1 hypothetical protein EAI05_20265 [Bacillus subtilis]